MPEVLTWIGDDAACPHLRKELVCMRCGDIVAAPPTTDTVLVSREDAAKIAERFYTGYGSQLPIKIADEIRRLPPYTKEHVDG